MVNHWLRKTLFHLGYCEEISILFLIIDIVLTIPQLAFLLYFLQRILYGSAFSFVFPRPSPLSFDLVLIIFLLTFFCLSLFLSNKILFNLVIFLCNYLHHFKFFQIKRLFFYSLCHHIIPIWQYLLDILFLHRLKLNQIFGDIVKISNWFPGIIGLIKAFPLNKIVSPSSINLHISNFVTLVVNSIIVGLQTIIVNHITCRFLSLRTLALLSPPHLLIIGINF